MQSMSLLLRHLPARTAVTRLVTPSTSENIAGLVHFYAERRSGNFARERQVTE
jgi:hypothetical protein